MRIGRAFVIPAILAFGVAAPVGAASVAAMAPAAIVAVQGVTSTHHASVLADPAVDPSGSTTGVTPGTNMYHHG